MSLDGSSSGGSKGGSGSSGTGGSSGSTSGGSGGSSGASNGGTDGGSDSSEDSGNPNVATLFVPDDLGNAVYRYAIAPHADPVQGVTIAVPGANSVALRSTGELFVADYSTATIYRFLSPFGTPTPNGMITGVSLSSVGQFGVEDMDFVDDELWVTDPANSNVVRLSFDANGKASVAGTESNLANNAGILWDGASRIVYVTQSFQTGVTIQHYRVASDHTVTAFAPITGNGLSGPDGMVVTSWGELLVADFYTNTISRFMIDAQGNATANGTITGGGLSSPGSPALAPWGEMYVGNQGNGTVSRFTFDTAHSAVPNGTLTVSSSRRLDWIRILPGSLLGTGGDGGATDAGSEAEASVADGASDATSE